MSLLKFTCSIHIPVLNFVNNGVRTSSSSESEAFASLPPPVAESTPVDLQPMDPVTANPSNHLTRPESSGLSSARTGLQSDLGEAPTEGALGSAGRPKQTTKLPAHLKDFKVPVSKHARTLLDKTPAAPRVLVRDPGETYTVSPQMYTDYERLQLRPPQRPQQD